MATIAQERQEKRQMIFKSKIQGRGEKEATNHRNIIHLYIIRLLCPWEKLFIFVSCFYFISDYIIKAEFPTWKD